MSFTAKLGSLNFVSFARPRIWIFFLDSLCVLNEAGASQCVWVAAKLFSLSLSLFFFSRPYQYTKRVLCTPEPRVHSRQSRKQPWTSFGIIYGPMWNVTSYVTFDFHTSWSGRVSERVRRRPPAFRRGQRPQNKNIHREACSDDLSLLPMRWMREKKRKIIGIDFRWCFWGYERKNVVKTEI